MVILLTSFLWLIQDFRHSNLMVLKLSFYLFNYYYGDLISTVIDKHYICARCLPSSKSWQNVVKNVPTWIISHIQSTT